MACSGPSGRSNSPSISTSLTPSPASSREQRRPSSARAALTTVAGAACAPLACPVRSAIALKPAEHFGRVRSCREREPAVSSLCDPVKDARRTSADQDRDGSRRSWFDNELRLASQVVSCVHTGPCQFHLRQGTCRRRSAKSTPKRASSSPSQPSPMPCMSRPGASCSMQASCLASVTGSRRAANSTAMPIVIVLVVAASAAMTVTGSSRDSATGQRSFVHVEGLRVEGHAIGRQRHRCAQVVHLEADVRSTDIAVGQPTGGWPVVLVLKKLQMNRSKSDESEAQPRAGNSHRPAQFDGERDSGHIASPR